MAADARSGRNDAASPSRLRETALKGQDVVTFGIYRLIQAARS
jgi:hypothetical protein